MISNIEDIKRHIKTHTERSVDDQSAVTILKSFLRSDGKINSNFAENDKWPNTDGTFEFVPNPELSRKPKQNFVVQIKGTQLYSENNGEIKYQLKSLAFPAVMYSEVTLDPGILFIVLNSNIRGQERVFWKYMSAEFLASIDFLKDSKVINLTHEDEIENSEESISSFCKKLEYISNHHSFVKRLENRNYSKKELIKIIETCNKEIVESIDRMEVFDETRDNISKRLLRYLDDMCRSTLMLNAVNMEIESPNLRIAWEKALLDRKTRYLSHFLKGLRYIGGRIPEEGQSERLMLKYYDFLWQIRKSLHEKFDINVLSNLESFPLNIDKVDSEYHELLASAIETNNFHKKALGISRFYVQKKTPFFVGTERYFEITLQLSGMYTTKYNRITVYTKDNIATSYSVQIAYENININLWGISSDIKVITDWKVSIAPSCLNKLAKILRVSSKLNHKYGEYQTLMGFLTKTGIDLLEFIDLGEEQFMRCIDSIYNDVNTEQFKEILLELNHNYNKNSTIQGKYTIRYIISQLKEETLVDVLPNRFSKELRSPLYLTSKCYPFEKNPYIANLVGRKTTSASQLSQIQNVTGMTLYNRCHPFVLLKNLIHSTGEIYFQSTLIASQDKIDDFNNSLDSWQRNNKDIIAREGDMIYIESFEEKTIKLLKALINYANRGNRGQKELNNKFLRENKDQIDDPLKEAAMKNIFVNSHIMLIYGAAGTGKTRLINYISNLMSNSRKLFLTKTHTTLQNLRRGIDNPGSDAEFVSFDRFTKKVGLDEYDIIFVDECGIIDNEVMLKFIEKISEDTFVVLAGDIFQIESINFGNWFYYAKDLVKTNGSNIELTNTWRTEVQKLKGLWHSVRIRSTLITEKLAIDGEYSEDIGGNIFSVTEKDEVILCLNYDGKFGLNNMNQYFQNANKMGDPVGWQEWIYKVGDPIIFNDTKRFTILYNNLKGKIVEISKTKEHISFTVDVNILLTESDCRNDELEFIDIVSEETTRIRFTVIAYDDSIEDDDMDKTLTVIPFQIAYAVSIHKAQGLEFDSVKVIIPSSNSERITHDVFYTAITRAKKKLKIFWSSETMKEIINGFAIDDTKHRSLDIIKNKLSNDI